MSESNFQLINKNKIGRVESGSSSHSQVECFERSKSNSKPYQTIYLMVYLGLQKNVKTLVQSCKKIVLKTNRNAFRQICDHAKNDKIHKNVTNYFASTQKLKTQRGKLRATLQQHNPEKKARQIENLCFKKTLLTLKNAVSIADNLAKNILRMSWIKMQCFRMQTAIQDYHNQVSSEAQNLNKNVSRLSNKRKVTKGREEYKQNSRLSATEIIAENQRLKNELMNDQYEREAFVEQLGELLQKHEKQLAQGYSTTRTHKKNK